jgi:hypothetical protein
VAKKVITNKVVVGSTDSELETQIGKLARKGYRVKTATAAEHKVYVFLERIAVEVETVPVVDDEPPGDDDDDDDND